MALKGIQVLEAAGLVPGPVCSMILADFGARVIRIDKIWGGEPFDEALSHGKLSVALNLKTREGADIFKKLSRSSDVVIDPFRRGVMENLGLGPEQLMKENEKLVYARLSGYGHSGPMSSQAGHDINFVATSGVLSLLKWGGAKPSPPVNILADMAGGGLACAMGILLALVQRQQTGLGQIVDNSMTRSTAYLSTYVFSCNKLPPLWDKESGQNWLDGGYFVYDTYKTKDGKYMAVGSIEPQFQENLLKGLGLSPSDLNEDNAQNKEIVQKRFSEENRDYWTKVHHRNILVGINEACLQVFTEFDACVTPVLTVDEAVQNEHNRSQGMFVQTQDGKTLPSPEPRLSATPGCKRGAPPRHGEHTLLVLKELGYSDRYIAELIEKNAVSVNLEAKI